MKSNWPDNLIMFMGLDCSTKAIHSVLLDMDENIKVQYKWARTEKTFPERFPLLIKDFWEDISRIRLIRTERRRFIATVEESIYIQNYYNINPNAPYYQVVIKPKLEKLAVNLLYHNLF